MGELANIKLIDTALKDVSGGLCYFSAEAKHAQLLDAEKTLETLRATIDAYRASHPAPAEPVELTYKELIDAALKDVSGGLCYFSAEAKHAQLLDAEKKLKTLRAAVFADRARRAAALLQQHAAELAQCREALRRVRRWGGFFDRWDSGVVLGVMAWIDDGMTGPLPAMPSYLASLEGNGNA